MNETASAGDSSGTAKIIYILYLVNIVVPFTGLVGVVMAYMNQAAASETLQTHYRFQIRTFWIGVLYIFIGALLTLVLIGYLIILFYIVWLIIRCIKGMQALDQGQPVANPTTWMFG